MKPSIFTAFNKNIPFAEALVLIRRAGFEIVALDPYLKYSGYDTPAGRLNIKRLMTENKLQVDALHAPSPEGDRLFSLDESERLESVRWCRVAMDLAALLDAGAVHLHLISSCIADAELERKMIEQGRRSVAELSRHAVALGIKLALENGKFQWYDRVLELFLAEFGDPVGLCYDTGHANIKVGCFNLLEQYAGRLQGFHIHDNDGQRDIHVLPYEGNTDWERFRAIIKRFKFPHNLNLETRVSDSQFKNPEEFLAEARKRAERLMEHLF